MKRILYFELSSVYTDRQISNAVSAINNLHVENFTAIVFESTNNPMKRTIQLHIPKDMNDDNILYYGVMIGRALSL